MSGRILIIACSLALAASVGLSQQPAPNPVPPNAPAPPAVSPPYGMPITSAQARIMVAAVEEEAARMKEERVVIAIVQNSGDLVFLERMDSSTYVSVELAQTKARMAARWRSPSGGVPPNGSTLPDAMPLPGGLPIVYDGKTIGGVGISGAERGGDARLAQAALDALSRKK